ncbi:MAG: hypothetical protein IJ174_06045, partial [Clostridia bacterium]|nr:hypothetical protein [Clostridia bacterium]
MSVKAVKTNAHDGHDNRIKRSAGDWVFEIALYIFFGLFTLLCIFPFYYLFINTISNNDAVTSGLVNFYPIGIHFNNYIALKDVNDLLPSVFV